MVSDIPAGDGKIANLFFYRVGAMASIAVETTVDADVVEIVVAPRGCAVFFYLKNVFKINNRVQPQSGEILENRRNSKNIKNDFAFFSCTVYLHRILLNLTLFSAFNYVSPLKINAGNISGLAWSIPTSRQKSIPNWRGSPPLLVSGTGGRPPLLVQGTEGRPPLLAQGTGVRPRLLAQGTEGRPPLLVQGTEGLPPLQAQGTVVHPRQLAQGTDDPVAFFRICSNQQT